MTMDITEGMKAPLFEADGDKGRKIRLDEFLGRKVLLYFYPKDNSPGCSLEAKNFNDNLDKLVQKNIVVLGVSKDTVKSHCSFRDKYSLRFDLLADTENDIIGKYGVWVKKKNYGKEYFGIERATFAIDEKGIVEKVWRNVKAGSHIADILKFYKIE
jgi:thioredoxin-dependent peroxiredoxin